MQLSHFNSGSHIYSTCHLSFIRALVGLHPRWFIDLARRSIIQTLSTTGHTRWACVYCMFLSVHQTLDMLMCSVFRITFQYSVPLWQTALWVTWSTSTRLRTLGWFWTLWKVKSSLLAQKKIRTAVWVGHIMCVVFILDIRRLNSQAVFAKKTGMIILGGGLVKHHIANANLMVTFLNLWIRTTFCTQTTYKR